MRKAKVFLLLVCCMVAVCGFGQSGIDDTPTWSISGDTLTISGGCEKEWLYYESGWDCPWDSYRNSINTIVIENGVTAISCAALAGCYNSTSINIPESVTTIKYGNQGLVFSGCSSLITINVASGNKVYSSEDGVLFNKDKTLLIRCPVGKTGSYVIPESVTNIEHYAFIGCRGLTSVTIPQNVTSIKSYTFGSCSGLTSINIPSGFTNIESGTFYGCKSLTSITIPKKVTRIEGWAFAGCDNLTELYFNADSCGYIGKQGLVPDSIPLNGTWFHFMDAVYGWNVKTVNIGSNVKYIPANAFRNSENLQSIIIPDKVTSIGDSTFYNCKNLTYASIGNEVLSIGTSAFESCLKLNTVSLGKSLNSIDNQAFATCLKLRNIYCYGEIPSDCDYDSFGKTDYERAATYAMAKLYYSINASGNLYSMFPVWREFGYRSYFDAAEKEVTITPKTTNAQVAWNPSPNATAYELVIYSDASRSSVVCVLGFDADGRLTGISLRADAPFSCTVSGLKGGTTYFYTMTAFNDSKEIVEQKQGSFTTAGTGDDDDDDDPTAAPMVEQSKLVVYPNPTKGQFSINNEQLTMNNGQLTINNVVEIYDYTGRLVGVEYFRPSQSTHDTWVEYFRPSQSTHDTWVENIRPLQHGNGTTIDISHLPNGIYFIQINGERVTVVKR